LTDRQLLELIVQKVTGIESTITDLESNVTELNSKVSNLDSRFTSLESKVSNLDSRFTSIELTVSNLDRKVSSMETKISNILSQQAEHTAMIKALIHASEVQKAETEGIKMELAKLIGEQAAMREEQQSSFKALADMYGQHEFELAKLRKKSV